MSNVGMSPIGYNPDNDKDNILLEEIKNDPSPKEKLFDFLSKAGKEDFIVYSRPSSSHTKNTMCLSHLGKTTLFPPTVR